MIISGETASSILALLDRVRHIWAPMLRETLLKVIDREEPLSTSVGVRVNKLFHCLDLQVQGKGGHVVEPNETKNPRLVQLESMRVHSKRKS